MDIFWKVIEEIVIDTMPFVNFWMWGIYRGWAEGQGLNDQFGLVVFFISVFLTKISG